MACVAPASVRCRAERDGLVYDLCWVGEILDWSAGPTLKHMARTPQTQLKETMGVDPPMREGERERTGMGYTRLGELELVTREERDDRTPPTTSLVLGLSMLSSSDAPVNRSQYRSSMPARACPSPQLMRRVISESDREVRARRSSSVVGRRLWNWYNSARTISEA